MAPNTEQAALNSLVDCLRARARSGADRPAIHYFDTTMSYGDLERDSSALARALQDRGVQKGDRVAVFLQNEPAAVLAHYAIWKAGGIVVPLNIMFKERELAYHLQDSGACGVICQAGDAGWVGPVAQSSGVRFMLTTSARAYFPQGHPLPEGVAWEPVLPDPELDLWWLVERYRHDQPRPVPLGVEDVAYLHYTSGTTGPPKGAMITHSNVLFNARTYQRLCGLTEDDCILATAPLFHITGTIGHVAAAAYVGAPLVLLHRFTPGEALRQIERRRPTFTIGSITAFIAMMNHPNFDAKRLGSLQKVFSGGAPVSPAVVERWEQATGVYIHNVWGMTETTSPGTWTPLGERAPVDPDSRALSVGRAVPGTEVRLVDPDSGEPLGPMEVGELTVRGPNVFKGYWNKPDETRHAVRDGWLFTGDLAKMDKHGWVYWIERKKDMINVSGFKVWPREVEQVLLEHPAVLEAAVVGVPDPYRGETVKAVVVLRHDHKGRLDETTLIEFCRQRMANYKYPRIVEFRDELPKNPQGKILKYVLREESNKPGVAV